MLIGGNQQVKNIENTGERGCPVEWSPEKVSEARSRRLDLEVLEDSLSPYLLWVSQHLKHTSSNAFISRY